MGVNEVNESNVVVTEKKTIRAGLQKAAGAAVYDGAAFGTRKKSRDEVMWSAVGRSESNDAIAGADSRVTGSMKSNQESVAK